MSVFAPIILYSISSHVPHSSEHMRQTRLSRSRPACSKPALSGSANFIITPASSVQIGVPQPYSKIVIIITIKFFRCPNFPKLEQNYDGPNPSSFGIIKM